MTGCQLCRKLNVGRLLHAPATYSIVAIPYDSAGTVEGRGTCDADEKPSPLMHCRVGCLSGDCVACRRCVVYGPS